MAGDKEDATPARSRTRGRRRANKARGGIAFVEDDPLDPDDDLASYMHDDDVAENTSSTKTDEE